ncbi:MAG: DUF2318 domain-containing protein [Synergistaceae bacterium]|jgi:uncharacterized membrane protein|nr:DUF2318 domain-containing protein [Synergistaceae bacterium]
MKNITRKLCPGKLIIAAALAIFAAFPAFSAGAEILPDGGLFIPAGEVTEKAVFYPLKIDGVDMEVFAVKAPDGTIRTAFNTCQVCYDSGAGYYAQEGDVFVCRNCGNRFSTSDIEIVKGGCNPVPILPEHKTADENGITIPKEFLARAKVIFINWKY